MTQTRYPWWKSKTILTALAAAAVMGAWRWAVDHLYSLPPEALAAFQAITLYTLSVFGVIICWGLGMKNVDKLFSLKTEALSVATTAASQAFERREEKIEIIRAPKASHFDEEEEIQ